MNAPSSTFPEAFSLIQEKAQQSTAFLTLYSDFEYFIREIHGKKAVLAYVATPTAWVGASDPVCDADILEDFILLFFEAAKKNRKIPLILPASKNTAEAVRRLGYRAVQIGNEPWFNLKNAQPKPLLVIRQLKRKGAIVEKFQPSNISTNQRLELDMITREWLQNRKMAPLSFLNRLEPWTHLHHKRYFRVLLHGRQLGYLAAVPIQGRNAWYLVDLIRSIKSPPGVTELLVTEAMTQLKNEGTFEVTLGMSPLAPVLAEEKMHAHKLYWVFEQTFQHLNFLYGFQSLFAYKEKYEPSRWEPQFLVLGGKRIGIRTLYGIFKAVFPKGFIHTIGSSALHLFRQIDFSTLHSWILSDRIVPRVPPRSLRAFMVDTKGTLTIAAMNWLLFFTSVDQFTNIRETIVGRYAYSWDSFSSGHFIENTKNLIIASFLHWNWNHLVSNTLLLFIVGGFLECISGTVFLFLCFSLGILFTNPLTSIALLPLLNFFSPNLLHPFFHELDVGCSLGIFACIGAVAYFSRFAPFIIALFSVGTIVYAGFRGSLLDLNHLFALFIGYFLGRIYVSTR